MLLYLKPFDGDVQWVTISSVHGSLSLHFPLLSDPLHVPILQKMILVGDYFMMILFESDQASWRLCVPWTPR